MSALQLVLLGDVLLGRGVGAQLREVGPRALWGDTLPVLHQADLRLINLECAISDRGQRVQPPRAFYFRAEPAAIEALQVAKIDACSLANNHTLDFGEEALFDTLALLDEARIEHAGAGRNLEEAREPAILEVREHKVALLALTDTEPGFAATTRRPGTNYLMVGLDRATLEALEEQIQVAKSAGATKVIVSNHWGPNMVLRPQPQFREFAHAVIDAGADAYFGHSAHVFHGVEKYRDRWILYDAGDFLDDFAIHTALRNDWSYISRLTFENGHCKLELIPVRLTLGHVELAHGEDRERMIERQIALSAELGTQLTPVGRHLEAI